MEKTKVGRVSLLMLLCCGLCVLALVVVLLLGWRKDRMKMSVESGSSVELKNAEAELSSTKEKLKNVEKELAETKTELEARKATEGTETSESLEKAWTELANKSGEITVLQNELEDAKGELAALREEFANANAGFTNAGNDEGNYMYVDFTREWNSYAASKLQFGRPSPYSIPAGSVLEYDTEVRWLNEGNLSALETVARQIYMDQIVTSWKTDNQHNLAELNLDRVYFTQGRYRNQNSLMFAFRAHYVGTNADAWYYTCVGFYDVDLLGDGVRVNTKKYFSPIALWDYDASEGLGANYQVSSDTSVAGYGTLREMESRVLLEDSRNHWCYYNDVY